MSAFQELSSSPLPLSEGAKVADKSVQLASGGEPEATSPQHISGRKSEATGMQLASAGDAEVVALELRATSGTPPSFKGAGYPNLLEGPALDAAATTPSFKSAQVTTPTAGPEGEPARVHFLLDAVGLAAPAPAEGFEGLDEATFQDRRWQNALEHLGSRSKCADVAGAQALLRQGANAFGLWCVSEATLAALGRHLLGQEPRVSEALQAWIEDRDRHIDAETGFPASRKLAERQLADRAQSMASITQRHVDEFTQSRPRWIRVCQHWPRAALSVVVFFASVMIATPKNLKDCERLLTFGWPLTLARATGVGSLVWTAFLFLSMCRSLLKALNRWLPFLSPILHENARLHVFCGVMVLLCGVVHTAAHLLSTYWALATVSVERLNSVLKCADPAVTRHVTLPFLNWLPCPLDRKYSFMEGLLSAEGLSGGLLLLVILLIGFTGSRKRRHENFELFWYAHNFGMALWLALLFVHGTQGWFGLSVPMVLPFCAVPVAIYAGNRIMRLLRYYLLRDVRILSVVIRPGKDGGARGALTALKVSKPSKLWRWQQDGMYAYVCLPEYAPCQWHPFTICSSAHDETVDFIVAGVGDWTQALAQRCLSFKAGRCPALPAVALDGPYAAPATEALGAKILIAVGAGVGITPFLALMAHIVAVLGDDGSAKDLPLEEAHFFWMARSADEFLFGRNHFTNIFSHPRLRTRVFVHLHLTQREPAGNAAAYLFREAVRRQAAIDREAFQRVAPRLLPAQLISGAQLPWCWVNGSRATDVLWVSSLVESDDVEEEDALANAFRNHEWAHGVGLTDGCKRTGTGLLNRNATAASLATSRARLSTGSLSTAASGDPVLAGLSAMIPVAFGRPDFATEIQSIGKARPQHDINVHVCGNDALVEALENICELCTQRAASGFSATEACKRPQRYLLAKENFGQA